METTERSVGLTQEEKDKCVICGKETPYRKSDHIDARLHYVEGCGQLCRECYTKF